MGRRVRRWKHVEGGLNWSPHVNVASWRCVRSSITDETIVRDNSCRFTALRATESVISAPYSSNESRFV